MDPTLMASLKIFSRSFIFILLSSSILYTQSFMTTNNANDIFKKSFYSWSEYWSIIFEFYRNIAGVLSKSSVDKDLTQLFN